jgi:ADP-ribose pyrophosphatase YjhB (NUDIX family)
MINNYLKKLNELTSNYIPAVLGKIKYNEEDLQDFQSIGAIFTKDSKILMLDHVKFNFWTVPIGKVPKGKTVEQGLRIEMKEELNVHVVKYELKDVWKRTFIWQGNRIKTENFLYLIHQYRGKIKNNEPHKARSLKYMSIDEIKKQRVSEMTKSLLKVYGKGKLKI